ncbi:M20 family metallopeptidase [Streptomyces sp. SAS_269]|uniref:M20 family metallopeptidase n=1 Tax=Streptomyces sp. SAS_269 TaxID=3412749 RepID=UPI00403CC900
MTAPGHIDFDGLLGARRLRARAELADAVWAVYAQQAPEKAGTTVPPADARREPRLCSQLVLGGLSGMTMDQLLLAGRREDPAPLTVAADDEGVVVLPGLGRVRTGRRAGELTVRYDDAARTLTVDGEPMAYELEPCLMVPGTRIELVDRLDPVLKAFLDLHIDDPERLTLLTDGAAQLPCMARALDIIAAVSPGYHAALVESLRAVVLYRHPDAESFAALGMHGMIFLNVPDGAGVDHFVEELVHQGGHVVFSEATLHRAEFFRVDPEAELSGLIGRDDPRTVYDAFHGLFTEHMEYQIVLGALERGLADDGERPEFRAHLTSVARRHLRDLRLIGPHAREIFSTAGREVLAAFQETYDRAAAAHPDLFGSGDDVEDLLRELVAIPSVNPLLPGAEGVADERDLAEFVAGRLRSVGVDVEMREVRDGRRNVIAHVPRAGDADGQVVLLSAHMDTYPAGGPRAGYRPVTEGRTLHGRGSADAKGSLAAMMTAFVQAAHAAHHREAYLAATVDEECLLLGARELARHGMRPTLGITGEPTRLAPVVAQKGIVRGAFTVRGPRSHAAYPAEITAVGSASELIAAVRELNARLRRETGHPRLGAATVTVTRLDSDGGMNLGATEVSVHFDARFLPGTTGEEFAARVEGELRAALGDHVDLSPVSVDFVSPPNDLPPVSPLADEFFAAVKESTGACEPEAFSYGSEAGVLAEFCTASLVFGPGDPRHSHAGTESVDLDEVRTATDIFRRLLVGDQR